MLEWYGWGQWVDELPAVLLAGELEGHITAVDILPEFLDELQARAHAQGVAEKISTLNCYMDALPFAPAEFDLIWSEGAL